MKRLLLVAISTVALAGCATMTMPMSAPGNPVFGPAANPRSNGFTNQRVEADRYRVSFRGPAGGASGQTSDYALLHAAELTIAEGYDWFRVVNRNEETAQPNGPRINLGTGSSSYGRRSAVGVGVSTGFNLGGGASRTVSLEVKMAKGTAPAGDRDAYDARDVSRTIRARM